MTDMKPTQEEVDLFEREVWRSFAKSYAPLTSQRRYSDMLHGWLTAHRARDAEVERLRSAINDANDCLILEINPSNYDHDGVCELNANAIEAGKILDEALATTPADSNDARKAVGGGRGGGKTIDQTIDRAIEAGAFKPYSFNDSYNGIAASRSYPDDHGQYECTCVSCEQQFFGGKGRKLCRECADSNGSGVLPHKSQVRALRRMVNRHCGEPFTGILDQLIGHTKNQPTPESGVPDGADSPEWNNYEKALSDSGQWPEGRPLSEVQDGWKLVPVEPTKRQVYAAEYPIDDVVSMRQSSQHEIARAAYQAMLNAAPRPDQGATNAAGEPLTCINTGQPIHSCPCSECVEIAIMDEQGGEL